MSNWIVDETTEHKSWFMELDEAAQIDIYSAIAILSEIGPMLGRPNVDTFKGSRYQNMKELRVQSNGRPFRIFFAFDPKRKAILLIGGNKEGNDRFYDEMIPKADALYEGHLKKLEKYHEKSKLTPKKKNKTR